MPQIHLVQRDGALSDGWTCIAMCGEMIQSAAIGAMCDGVEFADFVGQNMEFCNLTRVCRKCAESKWTMRYLYAVRECCPVQHYGIVNQWES